MVASALVRLARCEPSVVTRWNELRRAAESIHRHDDRHSDESRTPSDCSHSDHTDRSGSGLDNLPETPPASILPQSAPLRVACRNPRCGKALSVPPKYAGRNVKCPACGEVVTIPERNGGAASEFEQLDF
jgi:ribosomal protein S27E